MALVEETLNPADRQRVPMREFAGLGLRVTLRNWSAELEPFPNRWRRAARASFITALGAAIMATLQIEDALGLTLLLSFAAPEAAFSLRTGVVFLVCTAAIQFISLSIAGALTDLPVVHLCVFMLLAAVSTYLIYGVQRLGRLWVWAQIPCLSTFYMVLFDRRTTGADNAQMFAGIAVASVLLWLFNSLIQPQSAQSVLASSLQNTLERSRQRVATLLAIFLADGGAKPEHDRDVASKLGHHLALLRSATGSPKTTQEPAMLLSAVMIAERIHNEVDRLSVVAQTQLGAGLEPDARRELLDAAGLIDAALGKYIVGLATAVDARVSLSNSLSSDEADVRSDLLRRLRHLSDAAGPAAAELVRCLANLARLLVANPNELPRDSVVTPLNSFDSEFPLNKFLVRFSLRHTIAMTVAFVAGLYDNNAALRAALWLLMIGGPPSHGATAKKFTVRAIGAAGALIFAALATILLAPNFTSLPPYAAAIFLGLLPMAYVGESGGQLSYLAIGGTAFVIAFSGPGPRPDMFDSIWTILGISFGMVVRAIVSVLWREHSNRTLAEEFVRPLEALLTLVPRDPAAAEPSQQAAEMAIVRGIQEMLSVVVDAQLEGRASGIDTRRLVDALDTMQRLGFTLSNAAAEELSGQRLMRADPSARGVFYKAIRVRIESWLADLRVQLEPGQLSIAPLRRMVSATSAPELDAALADVRLASPPAIIRHAEHAAELIVALENHLASVSLHRALRQ
jgi:hypothetical protein